jgi:tyrosine phenol-lyase
MDVAAKSCQALYEERGKIKGLERVYEPESLRFFQARFEEISQPVSLTADSG